MRVSVLRWISLGLLLSASFGANVSAPRAEGTHAKDNNGFSITVAFGFGLNTLPATGLSGPPNHHVLPPEIKIWQGGGVHFLVSGFHMVVVYEPGTKPSDIVAPMSGTFISDPTKAPPTNVFY